MASEMNSDNFVRAYEWSRDVNDQIENDLKRIEATLRVELERLEKSLSSPLEKESFEGEPSSAENSILCITDRIVSVLKGLSRAREMLVKENGELRRELKEQQFLLEEIEMERDVLLQQVHAYLETNSSLKVRLEEQRCQTGAVQRQMNADLEARIKSLENDKEQLSDLNMEKEKQIHKMTAMLEQTAKCLKNREMEVLSWKNEGNELITLLKADLQKALREKTKVEEKYANLKGRFEVCFSESVEKPVYVKKKKDSSLKRSLSMGDFKWTNSDFMERNVTLARRQDSPINGLRFREFSKSTIKAKLQQSEDLFPNPWRLHASRSWPNPATTSPRTVSNRSESPPVHAQLDALRSDLLNVTKKLEALKFQLISSGVLSDHPKPPEIRSLKRKANPIEEAGGGISEEQKLEFKNLENILQDAKNLNAKLQNLREEKQKMIDLNKKEAEVQETEKKNDGFSQTAREGGSPVGNRRCKTR